LPTCRADTQSTARLEARGKVGGKARLVVIASGDEDDSGVPDLELAIFDAP
jgi:hypothetical protein